MGEIPASALSTALVDALDRCTGCLLRGIITYDEFLDDCVEQIGQAARIHPIVCFLGGDPSHYHDETVWNAARSYLDEKLSHHSSEVQQRQLHDAVTEGIERPRRWREFAACLRQLRDVSAGPAGVEPATVLALRLLREGCRGHPLEDRQVEGLVWTLRNAELVDALLLGWPFVPEIPPGHGRRAWREAVLAIEAGADTKTL